MRRNLTDEYVFGILETCGGFYVGNIRQTYKVPFFQLQATDEDKVWLIDRIMDYLKNKYKIDYVHYVVGKSHCFKVERKEPLLRIINLISTKCYFPKKHMDECKEAAEGRMNWLQRRCVETSEAREKYRNFINKMDEVVKDETKIKM